jgi:hypothetical protein
MLIQFDHRVLSSLLMYLDHNIQLFGQAYTNYSGLFYPIDVPIQNLYAYAAPFKPFCNDVSITGASIMSGVYLNGQYVGIGQSGLYAIDHPNGIVYFNNPLPKNTVVSGNYSIKEISLAITDQPDWKLLFETKYVSNNEYNQILSGLPLDSKVSPILFLKHKSQENRGFGFAGIDNNILNVRGILIADTQFQKMGVCSILKDYNLHQLPITTTNLPFDILGRYTGLSYDYTKLPADGNYNTWIWKVKTIDIPQVGEYASVVKNMAIIDFELSTVRKSPQ